jgi:hypothetical protein
LPQEEQMKEISSLFLQTLLLVWYLRGALPQEEQAWDMLLFSLFVWEHRWVLFVGQTVVPRKDFLESVKGER